MDALSDSMPARLHANAESSILGSGRNNAYNEVEIKTECTSIVQPGRTRSFDGEVVDTCQCILTPCIQFLVGRRPSEAP